MGDAPLLLRLALLLAALAPLPVRALGPFQFDKQEQVSKPAWSRSVQAGVTLTGGNTDSGGITAEGSIGRRTVSHRLELGGNLAVARTRVAVARDENGVPGIGPGELHHQTQATRQAWGLHLRYDLFATPNSSAYAAVAGGGDRPAGKRLVLSGQVGYGVNLVHAETQTLRVELGYDLSREAPVVGRTLEIHSARLFLGYTAQLDERLTLTVEGEALTNLNPEPSAGTTPVRRFQDTRLAARLTATHKLTGALSLCLKLTATYDHAPPLQPPPPGTSFEAGYAPLAEKLDRTADLLIKASF